MAGNSSWHIGQTYAKDNVEKNKQNVYQNKNLNRVLISILEIGFHSFN